MKLSYLLLTATAMTMLTSALVGGWFGKLPTLSHGPRQIVGATAANASSWRGHLGTPRYASTLHHHLRAAQ